MRCVLEELARLVDRPDPRFASQYEAFLELFQHLEGTGAPDISRQGRADVERAFRFVDAGEHDEPEEFKACLTRDDAEGRWFMDWCRRPDVLVALHRFFTDRQLHGAC